MAPGNGTNRPRREPARARDATRPPLVAAGRDSPSLRANQYTPSPARIGCPTIIQRIATSQRSIENRSMGIR